MTDPLSEPTQALRAEGDGDDPAARSTRARVLASLHQARLRRRTRLVWLVPVVAPLAAATAWAAASGSLPEAWKAVTALVSNGAPEADRDADEPANQRSSVARPPIDHLPPVPAIESAPMARAMEPPAASGSGATTATPSARRDTDAGAERDPSHELYRAAHRAHFVEKDPAAALTAWEHYLRKAPGGRFAVEAKYNRALCLVRLGRTDEARDALSPFARGHHGSYRKREASDLLDALGSASSP